jgi:hypothetical protein
MDNRFEKFHGEAAPDFCVDCSKLLIDILEYRRANKNNVVEIANQVRKVLNLPLTLNCGRVPGNAILSGCFLLIKNSNLYDQFNAEEKEKIDFIMEVLLYGNVLLTRHGNAYRTGLDLMGNFFKGWGPNFKFSIYPQVVYGLTYFGGEDRANEMLVNFSFDAMLEKMQCLGFNAAYDFYNARKEILKRIFEEGGEVFITNDGNEFYAGTGVGIKHPYKWEFEYKRLNRTPKVLVKINHPKAVVSKVDVDEDGSFDAYILDGTTSPWEGQDGMFAEFDNGQPGIIGRSSLHYCFIDFMLETALIETCKFAGIWDIDAEGEEDAKSLVLVGVNDLLYKAEHGYHSLVGTHRMDMHEMDAFNFIGLKNYWLQYRL